LKYAHSSASINSNKSFLHLNISIIEINNRNNSKKAPIVKATESNKINKLWANPYNPPPKRKALVQNIGISVLYKVNFSFK